MILRPHHLLLPALLLASAASGQTNAPAPSPPAPETAPATAETPATTATTTPAKSPRGMPDLTRGQQAAAENRVDDAEHDLLPLARRGWTAAQLSLARLYSQQQSPESISKAIRWYRAALPKSPLEDVALARLLLRQPGAPAVGEAERLAQGAYTQRDDPEALALLIRIYVEYPERDRKQALPTLAARAEAIDRYEPNLALIRWYRSTPLIDDHADKLLNLCKRSLAAAPECYVDLLRDARNRGDHPAMQQLTAAALSQYGQQRVPVDTIASLARALVDDNLDADEAEPTAPPVSDVPEDETEAPGSGSAGAAAAPAVLATACAQTPVGVALPAPIGVAGAPPPPPPPPPPAPAATGPNADPDLANQAVRRLLEGDARARALGAGVIVRYPFLAPDVDVQPILIAAQKARVDEAPLYLGELYLLGQRAPRDPQSAQRWLQQAVKPEVTSIQAEFFLGRLYQYGYLDEVDASAAQQHLLKAARAGFLPANSALARLYSAGKGVCPNHAYAYLFARLGAPSGSPTLKTLLDQLQDVITPDDLHTVDLLMQRELAARHPSMGDEQLASTHTGERS